MATSSSSLSYLVIISLHVRQGSDSIRASRRLLGVVARGPSLPPPAGNCPPPATTRYCRSQWAGPHSPIGPLAIKFPLLSAARLGLVEERWGAWSQCAKCRSGLKRRSCVCWAFWINKWTLIVRLSVVREVAGQWCGASVLLHLIPVGASLRPPPHAARRPPAAGPPFCAAGVITCRGSALLQPSPRQQHLVSTDEGADDGVFVLSDECLAGFSGSAARPALPRSAPAPPLPRCTLSSPLTHTPLP